MKSFISLITVILFFTGKTLAQCDPVYPLITDGDTSICQGNSITLHFSINPDYPLGGTATTVGPLTDDVFSSVVPIGFTFNFYGTDYTQCVISSNNYITFELSDAGGYSGWSITSPAPSANTPELSVMCPWQDIHPGLGGTIRYSTIGTAPNRIFVVEFCSIPMFSCTDMSFTNQIKLFEGCNTIETHIISKPLCETWNDGNAIHGLNKNASLAHIVPGRNYPTMWTASNDGYKFTPDPTDPNVYTIDSIPYNPFLMNIADTSIHWYDGTTDAYLGSGTSVTVTPSVATTYEARISSGGDCNSVTFIDEIMVDFNSIYYDTAFVSICAGETYDNHGQLVFTPGYHTTLITAPYQCDSSFTVFITINPNPDVSISTTTTNICEGDSARLSANNPLNTNTYRWLKNDMLIAGANLPYLMVGEAGEYRMVATTDKGCSDTSSKITIKVNPNATANILNVDYPHSTLCIGDTIELTAEMQSGYEYRWMPERLFRYTSGFKSNKAEAVVEKSEYITLMVMNQYGCTAYDSVLVEPIPCCDAYMPTVFSPNGDGMNDLFNIILQPGQKVVSFQIFNRRGNLVYDNNDQNNGWNGLISNTGDPANQEVYYYRIVYSCTDGSNYEKKGDITLVR